MFTVPELEFMKRERSGVHMLHRELQVIVPPGGDTLCPGSFIQECTLSGIVSTGVFKG